MHKITQLDTLHFAKMLFNTSTGHFLKDLMWTIVFVNKVFLSKFFQVSSPEISSLNKFPE